MGRQTRRAGSNKSRGKKNTPPTGQGKSQSGTPGVASYLAKRSDEPLQASRHHPELNLGDSEDELNARGAGVQKKGGPRRGKSGR